MASYVTSVAIAVAVLAGLLGLLTYTHDGSVLALQESIEELKYADVVEVAKDPTSKGRLDAVLHLGEEPGDLSVTVPLLAKLTVDSQELTRFAAEISLGKIGKPAAPHLKELVESDEPAKISQGATAIKAIGPGGELYLPLMKKWLTSDDKQVRKRALFAMQGMGQHSMEAIDLVIKALDDEDFNNQCMSCRILEVLGPDAVAAEDKLLTLMKEGNPSTRGWAALVLGAIGPTDETDTAKVLADNLDAYLQVEKQRTLLGIAHLGPEAAQFEERIRTLMNDNDKHVMPHAAYALWKVTGNADESIAVFREMFKSRDYLDDSIEFVGKMQKEGAPLVEDIAEFLEEENEGTLELAVVALGNIGPPAATVLGKIKPLTWDDDALIRYAAKEAIKQIEQTDEDEAEEKEAGKK